MNELQNLTNKIIFLVECTVLFDRVYFGNFNKPCRNFPHGHTVLYHNGVVKF